MLVRGIDTVSHDARVPSTTGYTILVIEDEAPVREVLRAYLERAGHRVRAASEAHEALALCREAEAVDLIVSDVSLPGMAGPALVREIAGTLGRALPVVFISGHADDQLAGLRCLRKPFRGADLERAVADALAHPA